jgi:hypothetical protein
MPPVRKLRVLAFASIIDSTDEPKVNVAGWTSSGSDR